MPGSGQPRTGADRDAYFNQRIAELATKVGLHDTNLLTSQTQIQFLLDQLTITQNRLAQLEAAQKSST